MKPDDFDDIEGLESDDRSDAPEGADTQDEIVPMDRKRQISSAEQKKRELRRRLDDLLEAKRLRSNLGKPDIDKKSKDSYYDDLMRDSSIRKKED